MEAYPSAFGHLLSALDRHQSQPLEVVILGEAGDPAVAALVGEAWRGFEPNRVVTGGDGKGLPELPLLEGRTARGGKATAWVCRAMTCSAPIHDVAELRAALAKGGSGAGAGVGG